MIRKVWRLLLVLWAGSLWSLALWVTWILFAIVLDRHLVGLIVTRLFSIECWLGLAVAATVTAFPTLRPGAGRGRFVGGYVAAGLLAVNEWALKPVMEVARTHGTALGLGFGPWHGVSAILYIIACIGVLISVWNEDFR